MNSRLPFLLLGMSAAVTACAGIPAPPETHNVASAADLHRIEVLQTSERVEVAVAPGDVALSPQARSELSALASGYLRYGHGALVMSTPVGGANADAAAVVSHETRMALVDAGVSYAAVAGAHYDAAGQNAAPIIISFSRYEARAPECAPIWSQDLGHQSNNQAWASFGCATQANLAAMIEDPRDLLRPRAEDPRDGGRRSAVFEAYRAGEQTHSERSNDERIAISNAVQ